MNNKVTLMIRYKHNLSFNHIYSLIESSSQDIFL
jgi:hypothetical protein